MENINFNWLFYDYDIVNEKGNEGVLVNIPHTNKVLPIQYFDEKDFQFVSSYKKVINIDKKENKRYILNFEGISMQASLYINGVFVASSVYGYVDFKNDISKYLVNGKNEIIVVTDSRESVNVTPFGGLIDYLTYGGIYREVTLQEKNETYIDNVHATYLNDKLSLKLFTNNENYKQVKVVLDGKEYVFDKEQELVIDVKDIKLWSIEEPNMYHIVVEIDTDTFEFDYGFRTIKIMDNQLYLNGKLTKIFGLNRHQAYPHVGYAATKNMQVIDAKILKDLGVNLVRTSHYPQSKHFLSACDKLGLLVLEEIPGWQHLGNEEWKETVKEYTKKMIYRDYNHPSIIIFGVRVNESPDEDELYKQTNAIAHEMDKTRFTGGIRCIKNSSMFEDIYTYNDFSYVDGRAIENQQDVTGLDHNVPYLITEFGGHTYPTKKTDNEHRLMNQLLRHARIQHAAYTSNNILGAIGWCAFDYNTHHQFGSGDKICHHGVMDIYRMPKLASLFYQGQKDIKEGIVLEPGSIFGFGERNYGGVAPLYVFTNCDRVTLHTNDKFYEFEEAEEFKGFKNKIFVLKSMDGLWGMDWKDGEIIGYINDKEVAKKQYLTNQTPADLSVKLYDKEIENNDATRIEVRLVDKVNNVLRFDSSVLSIDVTNAELLCPNVVSLYGGEYAFYVRATQKGKVSVKLRCANFEKEISFEVK